MHTRGTRQYPLRSRSLLQLLQLLRDQASSQPSSITVDLHGPERVRSRCPLIGYSFSHPATPQNVSISRSNASGYVPP